MEIMLIMFCIKSCAGWCVMFRNFRPPSPSGIPSEPEILNSFYSLNWKKKIVPLFAWLDRRFYIWINLQKAALMFKVGFFFHFVCKSISQC